MQEQDAFFAAGDTIERVEEPGERHGGLVAVGGGQDALVECCIDVFYEEEAAFREGSEEEVEPVVGESALGEVEDADFVAVGSS